MQATQNGSDLWLSYWVSHEHKERLRLGGAAELGGPALLGLPAGHCGLHPGEITALQGSSWTWAGALVPLRSYLPDACRRRRRRTFEKETAAVESVLVEE